MNDIKAKALQRRIESGRAAQQTPMLGWTATSPMSAGGDSDPRRPPPPPRESLREFFARGIVVPKGAIASSSDPAADQQARTDHAADKASARSWANMIATSDYKIDMFKRAQAAGVMVQFKDHNDMWREPLDGLVPLAFDCAPSRYRIKPIWEGAEPEAADPWAPLMAALAAGKRLEWLSSGGDWLYCMANADTPQFCFSFPANRYRIKPE